MIDTADTLTKLDKDGRVAFLKTKSDETVRSWNAWRKRRNYAPIDLRNANLANADLAAADLRGVNLDAATLNRARLDRAILIRAHLRNARMNKVSLRATNLNRADLAGANCRDSHFEGADLRNASFDNAILYNAHLEEVMLTGASLAGADLREAHLRDVALSSLAAGGLQGAKLYQTYFGGILSLRYTQLLSDEYDRRSASTVWEDTENRYDEAAAVYKSLKGYFEDAGDYEAANWAYAHEQTMRKLIFAPEWARWMYPQRRTWQPDANGKEHFRPNTFEWFGLALSDMLAGYGQSLVKPLIWLILVNLAFALIYQWFGMITTMPGCSVTDLRVNPIAGCAPTARFIDALMFSIGAMTTIDVGTVQPYLSHVGLVAAIEALLGIALTGLFGFVLGHKLRNS